MKTWMSLFACLSLLGGCTTLYPNSPLAADTAREGRCLAIRENTPLAERGTRSDPTTDPSSGCDPSLRYGSTPAPSAPGAFSPLHALFDAAYYE